MKYDVKKLIVCELGSREESSLKSGMAKMQLPEDVLGKEVNGEISLTRLDESILVEGNFTSKVGLICDRCLENFDTVISFEMSREYNLSRKQKIEDQLYVDKYQEINLEEPVREELILAIPMKNLCKEDCKGICAECGVNLNKEVCQCNK